jgi:hypothetical protein
MDNWDYIHEYKRLINMFGGKGNFIPTSWEIVSEKCVEVRYKENAETTMPADYISEITAAFTTANARMRLYAMLDWLDPSQVIYCDTDSVFFLVDEANPKHKKPHNDQVLPKGLRFGNGLGEWEDEMKGDPIVEIVCGGAKSYAYRTQRGKISVRQKGITLDIANNEKINFETMRKMVLSNTTLDSVPRFQFAWDNATKDVITKNIQRSVRSTIMEKRKVDGFDTVPKGYRGGA